MRATTTIIALFAIACAPESSVDAANDARADAEMAASSERLELRQMNTGIDDAWMPSGALSPDSPDRPHDEIEDEDQPDSWSAQIREGDYDVSVVELNMNSCNYDVGPGDSWNMLIFRGPGASVIWSDAPILTDGDIIWASAVHEERVADADCAIIETIEGIGQEDGPQNFSMVVTHAWRTVGPQCGEVVPEMPCVVEYAADYDWTNELPERTD